MVLVVAVGLMIVTLRVSVVDVLISLPADIVLCLVGSTRLRLVDYHLVLNVDSRCVKSACCAAGSGALSDMSGLMGDLQQSRLGSARQGLGCCSLLGWSGGGWTGVVLLLGAGAGLRQSCRLRRSLA